jgi:hypothetical protein
MATIERKGLTVDVDGTTQFATIYKGAQPVGTAIRKRVLAVGEPHWRIYNRDGLELIALNHIGIGLLVLAKHLGEQNHDWLAQPQVKLYGFDAPIRSLSQATSDRVMNHTIAPCLVAWLNRYLGERSKP